MGALTLNGTVGEVSGAVRHWRKLNSAQLLARVIRGVAFTDCVIDKEA